MAAILSAFLFLGTTVKADTQVSYTPPYALLFLNQPFSSFANSGQIYYLSVQPNSGLTLYLTINGSSACSFRTSLFTTGNPSVLGVTGNSQLWTSQSFSLNSGPITSTYQDVSYNGTPKTFSSQIGQFNAAQLAIQFSFSTACAGDSLSSYIVFTGSSLSYLNSSKTTCSGSAVVTFNATPTVFLSLQGSSTRTIRVSRALLFFGTSATTGATTGILIQRATNVTGGTQVAGSVLPLDNNNQSCTGVVTGYSTTNPTVTGAVTQFVMAADYIFSTVPNGGVSTFTWGQVTGTQLFTLRGTSDFLCFSFGGAGQPAGANGTLVIEWEEE